MKTSTMKWFFMVMVSGSMLFSCKKEEENNSPACGISLAGLSGSYKLTALQYRSGANATPQDYLASMDDCEKDNILVLNSDGTYDYKDMGTVCTDADNPAHGTWAVQGNTLTSDGVLNGTVASYDCKTMVYYIDNAIEKGDRLTYTMVKQ
ncbi:lipocalin-like domain-containing protein [Chitinophaga rupis]|nr:lipocalin family protein [Chitinophaga rupis]